MGSSGLNHEPVVGAELRSGARREEVEVGLTHDVRFVQGKEGCKSAVDHQVAAGRIFHIDDRRRVLQDRLNPCLALAKRLLTPLCKGYALLGTPSRRMERFEEPRDEHPTDHEQPDPNDRPAGIGGRVGVVQLRQAQHADERDQAGAQKSRSHAPKPGAYQDREKQNETQARPRDCPSDPLRH